MTELEKHAHRVIKIGIAGASETGRCGVDALETAKSLGEEMAKKGIIMLTNTTTGFPLWCAKGCKEAGGTVIGFSPAASEKEHREVYRLPVDFMDLIIYTGFGFVGRDLLFVRSADALVIGCGEMDTFHAFTIGYQDKKPVGVLDGPWQTPGIIRELLEGEKGNQELHYEKDVKKLIDMLVKDVAKAKADISHEFN